MIFERLKEACGCWDELRCGRTWEAWFQQSETVMGPWWSMIFRSVCEAISTWSPKLESLIGRGPSFLAHNTAVANIVAANSTHSLNPKFHSQVPLQSVCKTSFCKLFSVNGWMTVITRNSWTVQSFDNDGCLLSSTFTCLFANRSTPSLQTS